MPTKQQEPEEEPKKLSLKSSDDYDEEHFIERNGDSEHTVLIIREQTVRFRIPAAVQFEDGPGWFVVDRRGHRWALAPQGDNQFALDLHDKTPREVMEED